LASAAQLRPSSTTLTERQPSGKPNRDAQSCQGTSGSPASILAVVAAALGRR
jgi:hypothetical protein